MDAGQRSNVRLDEVDAPVAALSRVEARVSRPVRVRPVPIVVAEGGPADQTSASETWPPDMIPSMASMDPVDLGIRASWVVTAVVIFMLALVMGDDGPWIVVVPGLTALGGAWLDRRIPFSFAEGFIGYCTDPEPARRDLEESWPAARGRRAPAAP